MTTRDELASPLARLERDRPLPGRATLAALEAEWRERGLAVSATVDRAGGARLHPHDRQGRCVDRVEWPAGYRELLQRGYAAGVVADAHATGSLLPGYRIGYLTSFFDPGLYCPYTVSLGTSIALAKYGDDAAGDWLAALCRRGGDARQGATWMTEARGGSDLGANVETAAVPGDDGAWTLTGDKYFASNADADIAVIAARPAGAPAGVRGVALFAVPRVRPDGGANFRIRRLKDKIATRSVATGEIELDGAYGRLVGTTGTGIHTIMEVLNASRVANSVGSVAVLQRALAEVAGFARERIVFGRELIEQPLFRRELDDWCRRLDAAFALAWAAARELDAVWQERPPYSARFHRFRLLAHLAKYWTAEQAVGAARWAIEAHGGNGLIADYGVERLLREALVLAVWEGTPHRQMLDGLAVMRREGAHEALFEWLGEPEGSDRLRGELAELLGRERGAGEADLRPVFEGLAAWTAAALAAQ